MKAKKFSVHTLPIRVREAFPNAKTVSDAEDSISVEIQRLDREGAVPQDHMKCAMARACLRKHLVDGVWIGLSVSYVLKGTHLLRYATPVTVQREMTSFDRGEDFVPGIYRLSKINGASHRLGSTADRGDSPKRQKPRPENGNKLPKHYTARIRD